MDGCRHTPAGDVQCAHERATGLAGRISRASKLFSSRARHTMNTSEEDLRTSGPAVGNLSKSNECLKQVPEAEIFTV